MAGPLARGHSCRVTEVKALTSHAVPRSGRGCVPGVAVPSDLPFVHQMDAATSPR